MLSAFINRLSSYGHSLFSHDSKTQKIVLENDISLERNKDLVDDLHQTNQNLEAIVARIQKLFSSVQKNHPELLGLLREEEQKNCVVDQLKWMRRLELLSRIILGGKKLADQEARYWKMRDQNLCLQSLLKEIERENKAVSDIVKEMGELSSLEQINLSHLVSLG